MFDMEAHDDIDLDDLTERLRAVRRRLEVHADPVRERLASLGPAGLFAVAAEEQRLAELEQDRARRRVHVIAANAAQRLGEQLVSERLDA
jgi:hypothetical protein